MEITWARMEEPAQRRLWAEIRMSSYGFRETEVCYFCLCALEDLWGTKKRGIKLVFTNYDFKKSFVWDIWQSF